MRFSIPAPVLRRELKFLKTVCSKKATIPVLSNVLIVPGTDSIRLITTDLDTSCVSEIPAEVSEPGNGLSVNLRTLRKIARRAGDSILAFSESPASLEIKTGQTCYTLPSQSAGKFPKIPAEDTSLKVKIPVEILARLIKHTISAITKEECRYSLSLALVETYEDSLRMITTDGHRLAVASEKLSEPLSISGLVSSECLKAILALETYLGGSDIEFSQNGTSQFFRLDGRLIISRIPQGKFPDWKLVVPNSEQVAIIDIAGFLTALDRAVILADKRSHGVQLHFENATLKLSTGNLDDWGTVEDTIPLVSHNGKPLDIGFNAGYLRDMLNSFESGNLRIELPEESFAPVLFRLADNPNYKTVIMPMRLL